MRGGLPIARSGAATAHLIVELAQSKQAADIVTVDMRQAALMTDYFVICTGASTRQVTAIADAIWEGMEEQGIAVRHLEGYHEQQWVLVDCGDAVAHVFLPALRQFYDLEHLWGDMPRIGISS